MKPTNEEFKFKLSQVISDELVSASDVPEFFVKNSNKFFMPKEAEISVIEKNLPETESQNGINNNLNQECKSDETLEEIYYDLTDNQLNRQHLHALHRFRRHKKRANRDIVIGFVPRIRPSIVNRKDFFFRFGKKEQEALASFDFLNQYEHSQYEHNENNQ